MIAAAVVGGLYAAITLGLVSGLPADGGASTSSSCDTVAEGYKCRPAISHLWGQYSPFFSVPSDIDASVPAGCDITFVQVLSRHGARDPTLGKTISYAATIERIHRSVDRYGPGYGFIRDYNYTLGADQLSAFGQQQMINSGIKFFERYQDLASANAPFFRAAGQTRVVESGTNFTLGFHQARKAARRDGRDKYPYDMVILPETEGFNNTLSHGRCKNFEGSTLGRESMAEYEATFLAPITARLNANLPGANLSAAETVAIMELCPFNTVADAQGRVSQFCSLFDEEEWSSYDYLQSLGKYYGYGGGHPLGPTQGVGWVNELVARLTRSPVRSHGSVNATLDADPATFPLDRALYADFSHDNDMAGIMAAMGLYSNPSTTPARLLPKTERRPAADVGGYAASWTVPFAARLYVEKMTCGGSEEEELVRVLVNDRVVPLTNCAADSLGRCTLDEFVDGLGFATSGGLWDSCSF